MDMSEDCRWLALYEGIVDAVGWGGTLAQPHPGILAVMWAKNWSSWTTSMTTSWSRDRKIHFLLITVQGKAFTE